MGIPQQKEGIAIAKMNQSILLCHHGEDVQAGSATIAVEKLADYLVGLSY